jgi:prepilin-type N-terminal cleavage/methylation domain-containing protein
MLKLAKGFTIVELLIVVVVIAILAGIAIISYVGVTSQTKKAIVDSDFQSIKTKLESAKVINGSNLYPTTLQEAGMEGSTAGGSVVIYKPYASGAAYCLTVFLDDQQMTRWNTGKEVLDYWTNEPVLCGKSLVTSAVTKDAQGNYYVLNYGGHIVTSYDDSETPINTPDATLVKYSPTMKILWARGASGTADGAFNTTSYPWGVFVDPENNVWVADSGNHRFQKFDSNGRFLFKIGGPTSGSAVGYFSTPYGAAFTNDGHVWLSDRYNNRILKYTLSGSYVQTIATSLSQPHGAAVDSSQNIYVASRANHRIQKYSPTGTLLATFGTGTQGSANGQLDNPTSVLIDPSSGEVYTFELNNRRISVFAANGTYLRHFTTDTGEITYTRSFGMTWDDGNITMAIQNSGNDVRMATFSKTGSLVKVFKSDTIKP